MTASQVPTQLPGGGEANAAGASPSSVVEAPVGSVALPDRDDGHPRRRRRVERVNYGALHRGLCESSDSPVARAQQQPVQDDVDLAEPAPAAPVRAPPGPQFDVVAPTIKKKGRPKGSKVTKAPIKAAVAAAPVPTNDTERQADALRAQGVCSCKVLKVLLVEQLRAFCRARNISIIGADHVKLGKTDLLLECCVVCQTQEDTNRAVIVDAHQGIAQKYWQWAARANDIDLSILSAYHLAMTALAGAPENVASAVDLHDFRAHFLSVFDTNYHFYVRNGKVNKVDGPGQNNVVNDADRRTNFAMSCVAALNHYRDVHDGQTCGRLRKGLVCRPFRVFGNCQPCVEVACRLNLMHVLAAVTRAPQTDVRFPYPDQQWLRQEFGIQ